MKKKLMFWLIILSVGVGSCYSTQSALQCKNNGEYLILDVDKNNVLIELKCGGDRHWIDNYYHWNDSVIGNVITVLPQFSTLL